MPKKMQNRNANIMLVVAAAIAAIGAAAVTATGNSRENASKDSRITQVIKRGDSLNIEIDKIGSEAVFFPIEVDGTSMEVIAVQASDGTIRTAFNTCQSCYTSGAGYYKWNGSELVCQNCGSRFKPEHVEVRSGGCNPWPIFADNKTAADGVIRISYDFLKESAEIFANWKRG